MRAEIGVRAHHRGDESANPTLPLAVIADRFAAGVDFGGERAVLEGVLVAARGARARRIFPAVRILLAGSAACAPFGKIIVPCAIEGGTPSRCVLALTLRPFGKLRTQGEGNSQTLMLSLSKHKGATANGTQFRLRQNAGRVRGRKSKGLHGAHYTPARRRAG